MAGENSSLKFQLTSFEKLVSVPGYDDLVREYIEETASAAVPYPGEQRDRYRSLDADDRLRCVAVIAKGGELAGLAILLVTQSQHYPYPVIGIDSLYLRKPWRRGRVGLDLLGSVKAVAVKEGAPGFLIMAPPGSPLDRICTARRYPKTHNCYWCNCNE